MIGNIYTREKCPVCGGRLVPDTKRECFTCPFHPKTQTTNGIYVKFKGTFVSFSRDFQGAWQHLHGLRHEQTHEKFDPREYHRGNPLSFERYANLYLEVKQKQNLKSFSEIFRMINQASKYFGEKSVKAITTGDLREYLYSLKKPNGDQVSSKTMFNHRIQLNNFFSFIVSEEKPRIFIPPDLPVIDYNMEFRETVDIEKQVEIMDKIYEQNHNTNPKVWIAISLLCDHPELRPGDILKIKESDINVAHGEIHIKRPTKQKDKFHSVYIYPSELLMNEIIIQKKKHPALPPTPFFRHPSGNYRVKPNTPFGIKFLYKKAKSAMKDCGVHNIDLYALTRHSTVTAIADRYGEGGRI
ncbi:MAG: hypothetical protein C0403_16775 [Desulfobacterium sp.]|nr:hypothetical protein [Desulfobacterium sp.]